MLSARLILCTSHAPSCARQTYYTILYYTILYYTILYYTILYGTIRYDTILYDTILYYKPSAPALAVGAQRLGPHEVAAEHLAGRGNVTLHNSIVCFIILQKLIVMCNICIYIYRERERYIYIYIYIYIHTYCSHIILYEAATVF